MDHPAQPSIPACMHAKHGSDASDPRRRGGGGFLAPRTNPVWSKSHSRAAEVPLGPLNGEEKVGRGSYAKDALAFISHIFSAPKAHDGENYT